jgi:hypothetical protein
VFSLPFSRDRPRPIFAFGRCDRERELRWKAAARHTLPAGESLHDRNGVLP